MAGWGFRGLAVPVSVNKAGTLVLPDDVRGCLGAPGGGVLLLEEREDGVVLRTMAQVAARAQTI